MTYQSADTEEAHRVWTESITGNLLLAEYSDLDFLIYNETEDPWHSLVLEPRQMQALLEFIETAGTSGEASLGENSLTGKLTVRYQDGTYTLDPEEMDIKPTLTEKQSGAIYGLLQHLDTVVVNGDERIEM